MMAAMWSRREEVRRQRDLGGSQRAGQFSRRQGWNHVADFIKRYWLLLVVIPVGFTIVFIPLMLETKGVGRGVVVGVAVSSGIWFDVLAVLVWTGAGTKFMGANGEAWTAEVLRKLERDGWRLINGLRLNPSVDIDHVAIGPGGVLVVESKWSAYPWPLNGYGPKFMEGQLKNAAQRAQESAKALREWLREPIPVKSLAVFWSGAESRGSGWDIWRDGHTVLVHGPDLYRWLQDETSGLREVEKDVIDRLWLQLTRRMDEQDQIDAESGTSPPPTLRGISNEWVVKPMVGLILATYALWLTHFTHNGLSIFAATILSVALGIVALRLPGIRAIAIGWIISSVAYLTLEVLVLAGHA
jgi:hypothetical protein